MLIELEKILPEEMARKKRFTPRKNKKPAYPAGVSWNEPQYWHTLNNVKTVKQQGGRDYKKEPPKESEWIAWNVDVDFVLNGSDILAFDFDHVLQGGKFVSEEARGIFLFLQSLGAYSETSISGTGIHSFLRYQGTVRLDAKLKDCEGAHIEVYCGNVSKKISITGKPFGEKVDGFGIGHEEEIREFLETLKEQVEPEKPVQETLKPAKESDVPDDYRARKMLQYIPPSIPYDTWIRVGMALKNCGILFGEWDAWSKGDPATYQKSTTAEKMKMWQGFGRTGRPVEIGTLHDIAKTYGYREADTTREWYATHTKGERYAAEKKQDSQTAAEKDLLQYPLTDYGNAERIRDRHGKDMLFIDGECWTRWDGKKWVKPTRDKFPSDLLNMAADVMREARQQSEGDTEKTKYFLRAECAAYVRNALEMARGLMHIDAGALDSDEWLLNVGNGLLDLNSIQLTEHRRDAYCTRITAAEYHEGCHVGSLWEKTVSEILPDNDTRRFIQKWAGYSLCGSTREEKILFLHGAGGNGKGTLCESIQAAMGDYAQTFDTEIFLQSRNDGHNGGAAASPEIAKLKGARFALGAETEHGRKLSSAKLKNLTGGDTITARMLHGNPFSFRPQCKFLLASNYLPQLRDATDQGVRRRLLIVPFNAKIEPDLNRKAALREQKELDAILSWCVEGLKAWKKEGLGVPPAEITTATNSFFDGSDMVQDFLEEYCTEAKCGGVPVAEALKAYRDFSGVPIDRKSFIELMERHGHKKTKLRTQGGKYCFPLIQLVNGGIMGQ